MHVGDTIHTCNSWSDQENELIISILNRETLFSGLKEIQCSTSHRKEKIKILFYPLGCRRLNSFVLILLASGEFCVLESSYSSA